MRLLRYNSSPLGMHDLKNIEKQPATLQEEHALGKPIGLWVSVEGPADWFSWAKSEMPHRIEDTLVYEIVLKTDANLITLKNLDQFDAFAQKYRRPGPLPDKPEVMSGPNWSEVSKTYNGIIIAPYLWPRRMDHNSMWYYGWDCASGCIWRPKNAVQEINLVGQVTAADIKKEYVHDAQDDEA